MPLRKIGKVWYVDVYVDGRRIRKRASTDKDIAKRIHAQLVSRRDLHRYGLAPDNIPLTEIRDAFLLELRTRLSPKIYKSTENYLRSILSHVQGPLPSIRQRANEYIVFRQAQDKAPRTINLALSLLRRMFSYGVKNNLLPHNPIADLSPLRGQKKIRRELTGEEVQKLLEAAGPYHNVWEFFLLTGLRKGELVNLRWADVDFKNGWLIVRQSKTQAGLRKIPLNERLREILSSQKRKSEFVFVNQNGTPLKNNLLRTFKTCLHRAKIDPKGLDIHSLRYTFATRLGHLGIHPKYAQALLGHKSASMSLDIYTQVVPEELRRSMESLEYSQKTVNRKT